MLRRNFLKTMLIGFCFPFRCLEKKPKSHYRYITFEEMTKGMYPIATSIYPVFDRDGSVQGFYWDEYRVGEHDYKERRKHTYARSIRTKIKVNSV